MSLEDYTTYTEEDPNSDIVVNSSTKITVDTMRRDADAWVVKSYGAGFFGTFNHDFDFLLTESNASAHIGIHMLGTIVGTEKNHVIAGADAIVIRMSSGGDNTPTIILTEVDGGSESHASPLFDIDVGTQYYMTLKRDSTGLYTVTAYSDTARTIAVGSETLLGNSSLSFEYAYGMINAEATGSAVASWVMENLEFLPVESTTRKTFWGPWYWTKGPNKAFGQSLTK